MKFIKAQTHIYIIHIYILLYYTFHNISLENKNKPEKAATSYETTHKMNKK